ncbi:MAG TPA: hypothetical protein ENN09_03825 [Planctomycetes bacterium]|nr:hypothetical protein [Planctomycetota bacterium]
MQRTLSRQAVLGLAGLVATAVAGAVIALVYVWYMKEQMDELVSKNVAEMQAAVELDLALMRQRGYVASFIIGNGDEKWIHELKRLEPHFRDALENTMAIMGNPGEKHAVRTVSDAFAKYNEKRYEVIGRFQRGDAAGARELYLGELNKLYRELTSLCDEMVHRSHEDMLEALARSAAAYRDITWIMAVGIAVMVMLGGGLLWLLLVGVFSPIRRMADEVREFSANGADGSADGAKDEMDMLASYIRLLMSEVSETRTDMEKHKAEVAHSENLAAVGKTVAHIAHEIRNRLVVISGFAKLIEKQPENAEQVRRDAGVLCGEAEKLDRMVRQITDFSKPFRLEKKAVALGTFVEELALRIASQMPDGIAMEVSADKDTPAVSIDGEMIEQVVINLVRNAMEAMQGKGTIRICTSWSDGCAAVTVEDNGPGMPPEVSGRIFEPFFTTKKKGTGLGLAICRKIVLEHGGTMEVRTAPGQGTTFRVLLPTAGSG